jgi:hypothetical protein
MGERQERFSDADTPENEFQKRKSLDCVSEWLPA